MATTLEGATAKLLDFSQPVDVPLLDATVAAFYGASTPPEVRPASRHASCNA